MFNSLNAGLTRNIHPTNTKSSGPNFRTSVTIRDSILNSLNNFDNVDNSK